MHTHKRRAGWILILCGFSAWLSMGCSPASFSMLLMPFSDNKLDPEYKLFAAGKELKVVILSNFSLPVFDADLYPAENELADRVAEYLRTRCADNKHKIKIVPQLEVRNFQEKAGAAGETLAVKAGQEFKADYVLDLDIRAFNLSPRKTFPKVFRGSIDVVVSLYKTDSKEEGAKVFFKEFHCEYPGTGPIDAGASDAATFRARFLTKASRDLTKLLIAFPPEERMLID